MIPAEGKSQTVTPLEKLCVHALVCVCVCACEREKEMDRVRERNREKAHIQLLFFQLFLPYSIAHTDKNLVNIQSNIPLFILSRSLQPLPKGLHLHGCHANVPLENDDIWRMSSYCYLVFIMSRLMAAREPEGHHCVTNTLFLDSQAASTFLVPTATQREGNAYT